MADVNAPSGQTPTMAPPVRADDQILPHIRWVPIGKSNCYLDLEKSQSNPIYKITVDLLKNTNFFRAFTASSTIPSIYIQQFWDMILYDKKAGCYKCQLDEQWCDLTKETLREALQITPVNHNQAFAAPLSIDGLIDFVNQLGYPKFYGSLSQEPILIMPRGSGRNLPNPYILFIEDKRNLSRHTSGKKRATLIVILSIRFTKLIIHHLQRKHRFHLRPNSLLHLSNKEPVLGYLKFSAKGTKSKVFRMPIPDSLITAEIQQATYYREYLAKPARKPKAPTIPSISIPVASTQPAPTSAQAKSQENKRKQATKTTNKPAKAKRIKRSISRKTRQPRSSPKSVGASEAKEVHAEEPQVADKDADYQKALEESMKDAYALPKGLLLPVVIKEPESRKYQPLPEVPGKGKAKVTEEQEELEKVVLGAEKGGPDEGQAGQDPDAQAEDQTRSDTGAQAKGQAGSNPDETFEGQAGSNPDETSKGQAGPDPGDAEAKGQSISSHVVHAGSDQTEVESMVNVMIQQALSLISLMTSPIIDLTSRPESPKEHQQIKATTTDTTTTTTTLPPPQAPQQSMTEAMMVKRIGELEHILADLIQVKKNIEEKLDKHGALLYTLEQLDIPEHVSIIRMWESDSYNSHEDHMQLFEALEKSMNRDHSEDLTQDLAEARKKKKESRESPKTPPGSPSHQPPQPPSPAGPSIASGAPRTFGSAQMPPSLPLPSSTNQESPSKGSLAPSPSKTTALAEYQAWTTTDIRLRPSAHIPTVNLRQGWWKPCKEERPITLEPTWSIRSSDVPVPTNNWASALAFKYSPPPEDSLLAQIGDIATFIDWFCKRRGITELKPQDLEGPAYEIVKVFHPDVIHVQYQMEECHKLLTDSVDDPILRHNISKPLPLRGSPGQVTIQSDFFFNKDLEYLRYGSKGRRPVLSISKMKVAYSPDAGIKQMHSQDTHANPQCFMNQSLSMYGYDYMKKIVLRRADLNEHVIAERDFKYMYPSDFEDLYLLNLQGHLNHLPPKDKKILTTDVNQWTRQLVIRQRVEDFQLGIESYQTQVNLTKPQWMATGFEYKHDYTVIESPRAVIFRDKYGVQMMMRFNEIHKFSDGTLLQIDEALYYRVKEFRINRLNPCLNTRFWTRKDVYRCNTFMFAIRRRLRTRRIFRNLESFVGGRKHLLLSDIEDSVMDPVTHKFNPPSHSRSLNRLLFQFSQSFMRFYRLSHSESVDIEKVAVCSSLRSPKSKCTIESRAKSSSKIISLAHYSILLASSYTMKSKA
nr:hypothetical protein [Tanacetum cinerariifolium]